MENIEIWKLATDAMLMLSLGLLCVRFLRSPQMTGLAAQSAALEQTLRNLIRDAEESGRALNDQLRSRQQGLERTLVDVEGAEQRLKRAHAAAIAAMQTQPAVATPTPAPKAEQQVAQIAQVEAEPPSFVTERPAAVVNPNSASQRLARRIERSTSTNIYGEEIGAEKPVVQDPRDNQQSRRRATGYAQYSLRGLATDDQEVDSHAERLLGAIESRSPTGQAYGNVEHDAAPSPPYLSSTDSAPSAGSTPLDEIYKAAEQMLRAGRDLHYVAARTELPLDEVRVLSQLVDREGPTRFESGPVVTPISLTEATVVPPKKIIEGSDSRLGVFAARRPTAAL